MKGIGSVWSQWDLHFHTPSSHDYKDKSITNEELIEGLKNNNISVVAITDHHVMDVDRIKKLQDLGKESNVCVLPGIEFLSETRGKQPIHFIGIFSEDCNLEYVWGQIQHKTNISKIAGEGKKENEVYCDLFETVSLIKELGGIVTIHAGEKHGTIEYITNSLDHTIAQKEDIASIVDIYEIGKVDDVEMYKKKVFPHLKGKLKGKEEDIPMIIASDNHNIKKYELKEKFWLKGGRNFSALKYALNEPYDRFFIGNEPEIMKKINDNKTKYIKEIHIKRTGGEETSNVWFDNLTIPLNPELVTIIGNKGNGKSALADIVSLCSDGENSDDYLFLRKGKFLEKGLAERFSAAVMTGDGVLSDFRRLDYKINASDERKVKYLPQSYFDKICNEIGKVEAFRKEIEKVVFQYIPEHLKMKQETFQELVRSKKDIIEKDINSIKNKIQTKNKDIIQLENNLSTNNLTNLKSKLKIKKEEYEAHINSDPRKLLKKEDKEQTEIKEKEKKNERLNHWEEERKKVDKELVNCKTKIIDLSTRKIHLDGFKNELNSLVLEINALLSAKVKLLEDGDLKISEIITISFNPQEIEKQLNSLSKQIEKYNEELAVFENWKELDWDSLNLGSKSIRVSFEIEEIVNKLSGEEKRKQQQLGEIEAWEKRKIEIEGSSDVVDSMNFIKEKIYYLKNKGKEDLQDLREDRKNLSKDLFLKKSEIKSIYDEIKIEIDKSLEAVDGSDLKIVSEFSLSENISKKLLDEVRQNRAGTFFGGEDGALMLKEKMLGGTDWNSETGVLSFLDKFINALEKDLRDLENIKETDITTIVKNRENLYQYLFELDYLEPHYNLTQNGKNLEQLSPGEKGALLLVFYLVLDKDTIPLVIDQPEDNLDNNSVAKILVPFIRSAKKKRQIIMVTHNPNLAVVADSEQVIRVTIDKEKGNKFNYISGGIEDKEINKAILEVLEGNAPAFKHRKSKYQGI